MAEEAAGNEEDDARDSAQYRDSREERGREAARLLVQSQGRIWPKTRGVNIGPFR